MRLISLLFIISGLLGCGQNDYELVSDIDLINKLDSNLPTYYELGKFILENEQISSVRLRNDKVTVRSTEVVLNAELIEKVKQLNLKVIHRYSKSYGEPQVWFVSQSTGLVLSGEMKGIVYSHSEIKDGLVDDLDQFRELYLSGSTRVSTFRYRKVKQNWYLVYRVDF